MILNKVKTSLRLDDDNLDSELTDLIEACKLDLEISGVGVIREDDPLIIRAIITYCRAHFDVSNTDYERYIQSYQSLKIHLSLCSDYGKGNKNESM